MKKLLFVASLLLVLGAGCAVGVPKIHQPTVEGDWYLAFDLPNSWLAAKPYQEPDQKLVTPVTTISRTDNEIVLQNTDKAIVRSDRTPDAAVPADSYVRLGTDYAQIVVTRLDTRRVIPSEAEDLNNGFSKLKSCDPGGECQKNGRYNYEYYLKTEVENYKFTLYGDVGQIEAMERIIKSAQVVTAPSQE